MSSGRLNLMACAWTKWVHLVSSLSHGHPHAGDLYCFYML